MSNKDANHLPMKKRRPTKLYFICLTSILLLSMSLQSCAKPEEKRYELKGKIVSVDSKGRTVTISHEAIPNFMEAMTMPFRLSDKDQWAFDAMQSGGAIQATLVIAGDRSWLENPVISQERPDESGRHGKVSEPLPGDEIADYTLVNQDGKKISLHQYRGKALLLTFIYTRCPLPDFCPLMTDNFKKIDRALKADAALYTRTHLLSVTVDPEYDKPAVMRAYGARHSGSPSFEHWEFATGSAAEIKTLASNFGLSYTTEQGANGETGQIIHNLQTALIAPDGRLVKIYRGGDWTPAEVLGELRKL